MKLKHKGLFLLATLIICIIVYNKLNKPVDNIHYMAYTVNDGDTLIEIASEVNTYKDVRKTVYEIRQINNITPIIKQGQTILIPVKGGN